MEQLIQRYTDAWASRDPDAIVALHTEDTTFHAHAGQDPSRGKAAVWQAFSDLSCAVPRSRLRRCFAANRTRLLGRGMADDRNARRDRQSPSRSTWWTWSPSKTAWSRARTATSTPCRCRRSCGWRRAMTASTRHGHCNGIRRILHGGLGTRSPRRRGLLPSLPAAHAPRHRVDTADRAACSRSRCIARTLRTTVQGDPRSHRHTAALGPDRRRGVHRTQPARPPGQQAG